MEENSTWWKRRSRMEKYLLLATATSILIGISCIIALVVVLLCNRKQEVSSLTKMRKLDLDQHVCLTPSCIHTASTILKYMDPSVDPCKDFYQFTCGNFLNTTNIPDDKYMVSSYKDVADTIQEQLRTILEEPTQKNESKPFKLIKKLYKACMNEDLIEKDGLQTMKSILKDLGGWPVIEGSSWDDGAFDWLKSVYNLKRTGYSANYLIGFRVSIDLKNTAKRIITLDHAALDFPREFLIRGQSDPLVDGYYERMVDIAVLFGADKQKATSELRESLNFEIQLANISQSREKRRNFTAVYNLMTVDELQHKFHSIPWVEYMNTLLAPDNKVNTNEIVVVRDPKYLTDFEVLISKTPKRDQANYLLWRATFRSTFYLNQEVREQVLKKESKWKECASVCAETLPIAASALYVRKYFNEKARQNALEMVEDILAEFQNVLKHVDWMDDKTKKNALDKANTMSINIGYPKELLDDRKLEEFYGGLELDENSYLRSLLNTSRFETKYSLKQLRQPVNRSDWITHGESAMTNAFYSISENSINFPAGILQGLYFDAKRPSYMNYGAIGFVIGHEIIHGFDDQGRQFDKYGNLADWWDSRTKQTYLKKTQCIINQYGNITVPELGIKLNGINTQGENIADNGGIKVAYSAYNKWMERNGEEARLPGVKYSARQLFWVSAATIWCTKARLNVLYQKVELFKHAPDKYRVLIPFSNTEYFVKDFKCPKDSKMNPVHKCQVW